MDTSITDDPLLLGGDQGGDYSEYAGDFPLMPPPLQATQAMELSFALVRCVLCWVVCVGTGAVYIHYRRMNTKIKGWVLFQMVMALVTLLSVNYTVTFFALMSATGPWPDSTLSVALGYVHYVLANAANSAFIGLLLVLATGFCITRTNLGMHKQQVLGMPAIMFVTGVVTDVIWYSIKRSHTDTDKSDVYGDDFMRVPGWEAFLWFICTLLNLTVLLLSWVYTFDILQQEVEAIEAQENANTRRMEAQAGALEGPAPEHGTPQAAAAAGGHEHAAAPVVDPMLEEEGVVYYKTLMGAGQNMSHVAGADVEAQEFQTVADRANFEIKKKLMKRLSYGIGVYLGATVGVLLLPIFINDYLQFTISVAQFLVQMAFIIAMVWVFKPQDDSPYLMIGGDADETDALGMAELETGLDVELAEGEEDFGQKAQAAQQPARSQAGQHLGQVQMGAAFKQGGAAGGAPRRGDTRHDQAGSSGASSSSSAGSPPGRGPALPVSHAPGGLAGQAAPSLAPIRTSAPATPAAAAPKFSLGEEDEMMEIKLSGNLTPKAPVKTAEKKD